MQTAKAERPDIGPRGYLQLERPSERRPIQRYAIVSDGLYESILDRTMGAGQR